MTWNRKAGQKDSSYSRDFCLFFSFCIFLPFFLLSISCCQRQDSCVGESLISTSMVAPGQLNQRHIAMRIKLDILGFRNLLFSMNAGRKRIQRSIKKREKKLKAFFFKNLKKKAVRKVSLWSLNHSTKWEKFSNGLAKILKWLECGVGEQRVTIRKKGEKIWKENKTIFHTGLNWHLCKWYLFTRDF